MFYRLRMALMRFMAGRYGMDAFGIFLTVFYIAFSIIFSIARMFLGVIGFYIFWSIQTALFLLIIFRLLSRNIYKRQCENAKFLAILDKLRGSFRLQRDKIRFRKTHIYKKCPNCKANIKLPRRKGKHICTCPKCRQDFKVRVILGGRY